jgi:hypothetical protein
MAVFTGKPLGKEQLIMLPFDPEASVGYPLWPRPDHPGEQVALVPGRHAVVVSGNAGIFLNETSSRPGVFVSTEDDRIIYRNVVLIVCGPVWERLVQVSASVAMGGIIDQDADEVDHTRWIVDKYTWEPAPIAPNDPGNHNKRIRLRVNIQSQGNSTGWYNLTYQVVATGDLYHPPTADELSVTFSELFPPQ